MRMATAALAWPAAFAPLGLAAQGLPARFGDCVGTRIAAVGPRLEGVPDSGTTVDFANGGHQVSYEVVREIRESRIGDHVWMCLVLIPRGCPAGDNRGRFYTVTNLRMMTSWTLSDSQHSCGGA